MKFQEPLRVLESLASALYARKVAVDGVLAVTSMYVCDVKPISVCWERC